MKKLSKPRVIVPTILIISIVLLGSVGSVWVIPVASFLAGWMFREVSK